MQLAGIVAAALEKAGITAVLSGGAAVAAYTENRYLTRDIDFVTSAGLDVIAEALEPTGFERRGRQRYFEHPATDYFVEFPPGPPAVGVGHRQIHDWGKIDSGFGPVNILTPTQMIMDRLAAWVHWSDPQSFDQAVWMAARHPIDLDAVEAWAREEPPGETVDLRVWRLDAVRTRWRRGARVRERARAADRRRAARDLQGHAAGGSPSAGGARDSLTALRNHAGLLRDHKPVEMVLVRIYWVSDGAPRRRRRGTSRAARSAGRS